MTASCSTGPVPHRNGLSHRHAKEGSATAISVSDLDTPERFRQSIVTCHLRGISAISNRHNKLLELPVTRTKQTVAARSNRYKNRFSPRRSLSSSSRLAFVAPDFSPTWAREDRSAIRHYFLIHNPELDTELTYRKQKVGFVSNRQFFALLKLPGTSRQSADFSQPGLA